MDVIKTHIAGVEQRGKRPVGSSGITRKFLFRLLRPTRSGPRCDVVKMLDNYETPVLSKSITMLGYSPPELLVGWVIYGLLKSLWLHVWDVAAALDVGPCV